MTAIPQFRTYGDPPYTVAVFHGGPGACGGMAPVARELAARGHGVLEPLETACTIDGQLDDLRETLLTAGTPPLTIIGHSWGAWLGCLLAARHPELVRRLILVSSGPFETHYAAGLDAVRMNRLSPRERTEAASIIAAMQQAGDCIDPALFARFGALMAEADAFDPLPGDDVPGDTLPFRPDIFRRVWPEAAALRASGALLAETARIACPVTAIHGDYDPHPAAGAREPLSTAVHDFRFILLARCGHEPWRERHAREPFFGILDGAIRE